MIGLPLAEYERIRGRGDRFIVVAGHDDPEVERVVEEHGPLYVIEKFGAGQRIARELDPRS